LANVWKENILADWEFLLAGDLLAVLKRKFERENNELVKVVELKQVKQGS